MSWWVGGWVSWWVGRKSFQGRAWEGRTEFLLGGSARLMCKVVLEFLLEGESMRIRG